MLVSVFENCGDFFFLKKLRFFKKSIDKLIKLW